MGKMNILDAASAVQMLKNGHPLEGIEVAEPIKIGEMSLSPWNPVDAPVRIVGCHVGHIQAMGTFNSPVEFRESIFGSVGLHACYFMHGLLISGCRFRDAFYFQWGGHNWHGPVLIENTVFEAFADFEDCWFKGPVILRHVIFKQGSNLLGNAGSPIRVEFETPLVLEGVDGKLDMP